MEKKKARKRREHPLFDYSYDEEVSFECPTRGTVIQKVKIKRYKSPVQAAREAATLRSNDKFDEILEDSGFGLDEESRAENEID